MEGFFRKGRTVLVGAGIAVLALFWQAGTARAFPATCTATLTSGIGAVTGAAQLPITGAFGTGSIMASALIGAWLPWLMELADCSALSVYVGEENLLNALNINFSTLEQDEWQNDTNLLNGLTNMAVSREFGFAGNGQPSTAVAGSGCQSVDAAAAVVSGEETRRATEAAYRVAAAQYAGNVTARSQTAAHVNAEPPGAFSVASLFPPESSPAIDPSASAGTGSGGPTGQATEYYIQNLTDPEPPARPTGANYATPAGRRYLAGMKAYDARMSLAREALAQAASWNTAAYPLSGWLSKSLGEIGAPAPPANPSGMISENQMMGALVDGRFANPNWYEDIASESTSDLLREIAYENAILMKLELLNYKEALIGRAMEASRYAFAVRDRANGSDGAKSVVGNVVAQTP